METLTEFKPITMADKVKQAIVTQGRKKQWIAKELGIGRVTLDLRLADNSFRDNEIEKLKILLKV